VLHHIFFITACAQNAVDAFRCRWAYYVLCESTNYSAIYELDEL